MTTNPGDLAARLRQAIENGAFRYGDDDDPARDGTGAAESTTPPTTEPEPTKPEAVDTEAVDTEAVDTEAATPDQPPEPAGGDDEATGLWAGLGRAWHALVTWRLLPVTLLVITALLVGLGAVMLSRANADRAGGPMANQALVSAADTQEVTSQVSTALNQILSYDMANPKPAQDAAGRWLVGDAPAQYRTLVNALGTVAAGQKLTMVAKVSTAAVLSLHDGTAQLLVFLDQQSTRASDHSSSVSAAQVRITAVRTPGGWRISEIVPL